MPNSSTWGFYTNYTISVTPENIPAWQEALPA